MELFLSLIHIFKAMREMILAENAEGRRKALSKILPYQQADFKGCLLYTSRCV